LDKEYKILLDALGFNPAGVDQLVALTGLKAAEIASMLLILELEGHIESQPGGLFMRARQRRFALLSSRRSGRHGRAPLQA
jgi:DNA processing protein